MRGGRIANSGRRSGYRHTTETREKIADSMSQMRTRQRKPPMPVLENLWNGVAFYKIAEIEGVSTQALRQRLTTWGYTAAELWRLRSMNTRERNAFAEALRIGASGLNIVEDFEQRMQQKKANEEALTRRLRAPYVVINAT